MEQYPAIRGKLGSTEFYVIVVKTKKLAEVTKIQSPEDWEKSLAGKLSDDEIEQRKLDYTRVRKYIAPYIAEDDDRFFSSVIIAATGEWEFSSFEQILAGNKVSPMFKPFLSQLNTMGVLTISDGSIWRPLDGQHRIAAIRWAIEEKDHKGNDLESFTTSPSLPNEDVSVILIPYDLNKTRKIFTKVNLYAKKISPGEGLLINPYDIIAVLSRDMIDKFGGARLVGTRNAEIKPTDTIFTTLSALNTANHSIIKWHIGDTVDPENLPSKEKQRLYKTHLNKVWDHLLKNIKIFADALADQSEAGDNNRKELRKDFLLLQPLPQYSLAAAFARLTSNKELSFDEATNRLNKINWLKTDKVWRFVLINSAGGMIHRHKWVSDLIYYMAGGNMKPKEEAALLAKYRKVSPLEKEEQDKIQLPPKVA